MIYMSKTNLTAKQVKELSKNPYIKLVNNHYISYTEDFLKKLVYEMEENNKTSRQVFNECGIDTNIIGEHRAACVAYKWRKRYSKTGDIKDTDIVDYVKADVVAKCDSTNMASMTF